MFFNFYFCLVSARALLSRLSPVPILLSIRRASGLSSPWDRMGLGFISAVELCKPPWGPAAVRDGGSKIEGKGRRGKGWERKVGVREEKEKYREKKG